MLLLLYIHTFWRPWFRVICIYDDYIYLMQYIPADWNLQHSMILPLGPPKKARNISSKYERFAGSRRPVRSRSIYLTTMQIMNLTLKKSSKNIKKNKKTNPRCSHLKCEQLLWKKQKIPEDHTYMYLLEVSSSSSIIFSKYFIESHIARRDLNSSTQFNHPTRKLPQGFTEKQPQPGGGIGIQIPSPN